MDNMRPIAITFSVLFFIMGIISQVSGMSYCGIIAGVVLYLWLTKSELGIFGMSLVMGIQIIAQFGIVFYIAFVRGGQAWI